MKFHNKENYTYGKRGNAMYNADARKLNHKNMVRACYDRMNSLTYESLAKKAAAYFDENRTMPGEKTIKDVAKAQYDAMIRYVNLTSDNPKAERWMWNQSVPEKYVMDHEEFISRMSEIAVKDVELHGDSRPKGITEGARPFGYVVADRKPEVIESDCHVHEFVCQVEGAGKDQVIVFTDPEYGSYKALVPSGFASNHPGMSGMEGVLTAVDPSRGNFGDANLLFSIDLMQEKGEGLNLSLESKPKELELEHDKHAQDDFAKAIEGISKEPEMELDLYA